jgi:hypothetical protein
MAKKITNQYMMQDLPIDKIGTVCWCCGETTVVASPLSMVQLTKILDGFAKLHTDRGCNKIKLKSPNKYGY